MSKLKNITEMDYPDKHLHGYYVRVQRDGKKYEKMFSVTEYDSMEKALAQAIIHRNKILQRWQQFCDGKDEVIQYQTTNTGYPGISITQRDGKPELSINVRDKKGKVKHRSLALPPENAENYEQKFEQQFDKARQIVDEHNRARFGSRWHRYKQRKNLVNTDS